MTDDKISPETHAEAEKIAKGIQKPGQTKEQTKLISQGIEKGIAEYKKQQKVKAREKDKHRKKELKAKNAAEEIPAIAEHKSSISWTYWLPWIGLVVSWVYFVAYPLATE